MSSGRSDPPWVWWVSAGLMLLSGVAAWSTTALWWNPCRSSMLVGTILEPTGSVGFSEQCLVRMDSGTPYPLPVAVDGAPPEVYGLGAAACVIAALALVPVIVAPMARSTRVAGLALVASLIVLALVGLQPVGRQDDPAALGAAAYWLVDITTTACLVGVLRTGSRLSLRTLLRLVLLLGGVSTFGAVRGTLDYLTMMTWSEANWDVPPGTGYLPAAGLVLCSLGVVAATLRRPRVGGSAPAAAEQVQQIGPVAGLGQRGGAGVQVLVGEEPLPPRGLLRGPDLESLP